MKKRFPLIVLFFAFFLTTLSANHLLGGYMNYECLGGGDYQITLTLYRDCNCVNCADFDEPAFFSIYNCDGEVCIDPDDPQNEEYLVRVLSVPITSIRNLEIPQGRCAAENGICVEEGRYTFTLSDYGLTLPESELNYYIVYQRCCRSATVMDIIDPENTGMTVVAEITPQAYASCNNSLVFDVPPLFSTCVQEAVDFSFPVSDPDGDSLAIQFCTPYAGGGPLLMSSALESCEGARPLPTCPPPFDTVNFIDSLSLGNALQLEAELRLDSSFIDLAGLPQELGRYTVGLCLQEFKDNELVSETQLQFETIVQTPVVSSSHALDGSNDILLYPNPNRSGELWIKLPTSLKSSQMEIFNLDGRLMERFSVSGPLDKVNISTLPSGIYFASITHAKRQFIQKVFVAH